MQLAMNARMEERKAARRAVLLALMASLLVHLAAVLSVAWFYVLRPSAPHEIAVPQELTITMVEPPAPTTASPPVFVETSAPESTPPKNAPFESDRNTAAAAPEAAAGGAPLPTQGGREQSTLELEQRELALAKPDTAPPAPEMPPTTSAPPQPEANPTKPHEEIPAKSDKGSLAASTEPLREAENVRPQQPPSTASPAVRPSYRPQTRATRLSGSISNRGKSAVAALATPLGRYRKAISDAIGSSWYYHIGPRMDMFSLGTIKVLFDIEQDGKARHPRVLANSSNESFEIVTIESIRAAEIPPIPPDVLPVLDGGRIEIDFTFSIISY